MMTLNEIQKECELTCAKANVNLSIPVLINPRLKSTLGRVMYQSIGGIPTPIKIEFSKSYIENASTEAIIQTIRHECAHYVVTKITKENHGHDRIFKQMCAHLGCYDDQAYTKEIGIADGSEDRMFKYTVYCEKDGFIQGYHRAGSTVKNIEKCYCPVCKKTSLYVKQNW